MTIFKRSLLNPAEQRAILEFALNRVHEAAFLVDAGSHILYVNDEATRSLGYSREELLSSAWRTSIRTFRRHAGPATGTS